MNDPDRNSLAVWFPPIEAAGLPVPETRIVRAPFGLTCLLDGERPVGWGEFINSLSEGGRHIGWPCFLRTGHGSGKHEWDRTCFVAEPEDLSQHVAALVEWSHLVDMMGLPTDVWAIREMISTRPLFTCPGFRDLPVTREFRFFVRDDALVHWQPYWPADAVADGRPVDPSWEAKLAGASYLASGEDALLAGMAREAVAAVGGGFWSVDFLQDACDDWWLTDMALGDQSFRYEHAAMAA